MWREGTMRVPEYGDGEYVIVHYWIKVFKEPSEYGINGGRISKLRLEIDGKCVANYDRGWDIKPTTKEAQTAFDVLYITEN